MDVHSRKIADYMYNKKYKELIERDNTKSNDTERKALFTVFSGNIGLWAKLDTLYDYEDYWIKSDCFEKIHFSSGTKFILLLTCIITILSQRPLELFSSFDIDNYNLAIKAMDLRFKIEFSFLSFLKNFKKPE